MSIATMSMVGGSIAAHGSRLAEVSMMPRYAATACTGIGHAGML
jgi:hypothetical protein